MEIKIGKRTIGIGHPPFVIAEMSGNHNSSLDRALQIVRVAAAAGVDAIKLQTYTPDTMTLDLEQDEFLINTGLWKGKSLYRLYQEAHTPWDWHPILFEEAKKLGIMIFSTPFDETAVDFLESLDVPCYKIASFENTDIPLIQKVAATGKPLIISTGMANLAELDEAVRAARTVGCRDLVLLKCTSSYPATPQGSHLNSIPLLRSAFNCMIGLSDHTLGIGASIASIALGAAVIEKHFTLSRAEGGVDSSFSLEPVELSALVVESRRAWEALGEASFGVTAAEKINVVFRRSLYLSENVKVGDYLTPKNVKIIRPGLGLPPKFYPIILGKKMKMDAQKGTPITWELI